MNTKKLWYLSDHKSPWPPHLLLSIFQNCSSVLSQTQKRTTWKNFKGKYIKKDDSNLMEQNNWVSTVLKRTLSWERKMQEAGGIIGNETSRRGGGRWDDNRKEGTTRHPSCCYSESHSSQTLSYPTRHQSAGLSAGREWWAKYTVNYTSSLVVC